MEENIMKEESLPKKSRNTFKTKECRVIEYHKRTHYLDVDFDGYGIRLKDVKDFTGDVVSIKYKGEIGKSNFIYKL